MTIGDRVSERMATLGLSQAELARRVGISQPSVNHLIRKGAQGSKHLHSIARELHTTPEYLSGQTDDPSAGFVPAPSAESVIADLGMVRVRELDLSFGMGETYLNVPVTETMRHFERSWLRTYTQANPDNLFFCQGVGDSMAPTLLDSDLLLIDCSQRTISLTDKIWAIAYADCGAIKRLRPLSCGGLQVISDNPDVPNSTAYQNEVHVIGRVVAVVRKF